MRRCRRFLLIVLVALSAPLAPASRARPVDTESNRDQDAKAETKNPQQVDRVTFASNVADILQRKCQQCHRPGQVGPFSLLTYEQARGHARMIGEVVADRRMPPWHADPKHGVFSNDRSLTDKERAALLAWVDQGAPEGDRAQAPAPRPFADGWSIGKPDVVLTMPEPYLVAATGTLPYQNFRVKTNFKEDMWVQAAEARPGDRSVVHHILVQVDGESQNEIGTSEALGYLTVYVPGDAPSIFPPGTAKRIPAGADIIFQMHYTPIGKAKSDQSTVGLIFAKERPKFEAITFGIAQPRFRIPPGAADYKVESTFTMPKDIRLVSLFPHMHLRGKTFKYTAQYPDGTNELLLSVPAYDFAWQSVYRLAEPKFLKKGTRIDCEAHFDNSSANPANPDATKTVRWGPQTYEEMMIGYVDFADELPPSDAKRPERTIPVARPLGHWKANRGVASAAFTFRESALELELEMPGGQRIELEADYTLSTSGTIYGLVRNLKSGRGPVTDDVFSFRFETEGDTLKISRWKGSGVMSRGTLLNGVYHKVK